MVAESAREIVRRHDPKADFVGDEYDGDGRLGSTETSRSVSASMSRDKVIRLLSQSVKQSTRIALSDAEWCDSAWAISSGSSIVRPGVSPSLTMGAHAFRHFVITGRRGRQIDGREARLGDQALCISAFPERAPPRTKVTGGKEFVFDTVAPSSEAWCSSNVDGSILASDRCS